MRKFDAVVFDMDGTLVDAHSSWGHVHETFGIENDSTLQAFLRGDFDEHEFVRRDIRKWKAHGVTRRKQIEDALAKIAIHPGARELTQALRARGTRTALLSGGLDLLARRVCAETGIEVMLANGVFFDDEGRILDEGYVDVPVLDKGTPLRKLLRELAVDPGRTAAVGNSAQDVAMFKEVGLGIAFNPADDEVRRQAHVVVEGSDLRKLIPHLV